MRCGAKGAVCKNGRLNFFLDVIIEFLSKATSSLSSLAFNKVTLTILLESGAMC